MSNKVTEIWSMGIGATVALCLCIFTATHGQQSGTTWMINSNIDNEDELNSAIQSNEELIIKYPDAEFAPTVTFQLCELYARKAELDYQRLMSIYEEDLEKYDEGVLANEPIEPRISFQKTISLATQVLERWPTIPWKDRVLYRLGISHMDEGNFSRGKDFFEQLVSEYPQSPIVPEAHFRIGEYFFERREFADAIAHYSKLLEAWDSPYFDLSLYKLGWSYYNINDYAEAITTLIYLIDDANLVSSAGSAAELQSKADLRKEAIDYIAISFTEFGGPRNAKGFLEDRKDQDYVIPIFQKMADVYNSRNFHAEAIDTYETLLELYPFYHEAPRLYKQIVATYEAAGDIEQTNAARAELVRRFGPGSSWLAQYPEGEIRSEALNLSQTALFELGTYHQALGQENGRTRDYRIAVDRYSEYLEKFPQGDNTYKVNYYLAECLYEIGDYGTAAEAYFQCMTKYEEDEFLENAAYNRILCYYNLCQNNPPADSVTTYIDDFLNSGTLQSITVANAHQAQLIEACNDYDQFLPGSDKHHEILMKLGETLYDLELFDLSVQAYTRVAEDSLKSSYSAQAMTMIAQSYFKNENYQQAETWYETIADAFADSIDAVDDANRMIANSRFKMAELLKTRGEDLQAAEEFEGLSNISTDDVVTQRALYEAALLYEKVEMDEKAIEIYEKLANRYPQSANADKALYKAGVLNQSAERWQAAALDFIRLADLVPSSQFVSRALYNAGMCYENVENWRAAKSSYSRYVQAGVNDPDEFLEVLYKIADIDFQNGETREALRAYQNTVNTYHQFVRQGRLVDEYVAAHAQFMIGELYFLDYCKIELVPPLEANLNKKSELLTTTLNAYRDAAKYNIAEWTTASTHKIGMTYEEFVAAFERSPRPSNLSETDLVAYNQQLNTRTEPFKVQALEIYQANVQRAEENNIENQWIDESRERMQQLLIELGPRIDTNEETRL